MRANPGFEQHRVHVGGGPGHATMCQPVTEGRGMSQIINLNKRRKQKIRAEAEAQAAENRVRFGRTLLQKQRDEAEREEARSRLERLRRDPPA